MRALIRIEDVGPGGEGVGRLDGRAVFVPFTAPGDQVWADVPQGEGTTHATLLELAEAGAARVEAPCRHFGVDRGRGSGPCGGCEWLHLAYPAQLAAKERTVAAALRRIAKLEEGSYDLRPIVPSPAPLRYRTRAKFHHDRDAGRLVFFQRRSHVPVAIDACHLLVPALDALRAAVGPALTAARVAAREVALEWSELTGTGAAHLRVPDVSAAVRARAEKLLAAVPALAGLVLSADEGAPAVVGDPVLRQPRVPGDPACGVQRSRPDVFQQANRAANALLVRTALDLLAPAGADVLELHCGAGNFTGPLGGRARRVAAVEVQGPALELARADEAEQAGSASAGAGGGACAGGSRGSGGPSSIRPPSREVRFFSGDALALARAFARERGPAARRFDAALLDPPREGAKGIGPALRDLGVARAVYVSCDPATLARDVRACVEAGLRVAAVVPVDMFPQTHHVEAVVLLERGTP
ncbi:MAG TPA: TRAM domain-containing protein [Anaeromyxobacter sp.]|nr:TRAM domain-containing protein [Anaeromyxobacter sp.]